MTTIDKDEKKWKHEKMYRFKSTVHPDVKNAEAAVRKLIVDLLAWSMVRTTKSWKVGERVSNYQNKNK